MFSFIDNVKVIFCIQIGRSYMLKNGVVVRKDGRESSFSWVVGNEFDLKTDARSSVGESEVMLVNLIKSIYY